MKKNWLLWLMICMPLSAIDYLEFSNRPDRTNSCYEVFGYCPLSCLNNRTFFWSRPVYRNLGAQKPLWQEFVFNQCPSSALQIVPIVQKSFESRSLSTYFLFNNQRHILVKGDNVSPGNPFDRDVRAEWLGLPSNFTSSFSLEPQQKQFGLWIEALMPLQSIFNQECFKPFWISIALPYQIIVNELNPSEIGVTNAAPSFPANAVEALSNPEFFFGKFYQGKQKRKACGEIDFKFGTNFLNDDDFQIGLYSMVVIPLQGAADPGYVFSPFIGNNGHFGMGTGVTFKLPLVYSDGCQLFSFFAYLENIYFFRNNQRRTLDLIAKPWSRYLLLNNREGATNIPAVNILTRSVRARPYNMLDMLVGFDWDLNNVQVEVAYGLWVRGREKVKLNECFPKDFGIAGVGFIPNTTIPATASRSDIANQAANDTNALGNEIFVPIQAQDLDLNSGGARGALSQRAHFSIGYIYSDDYVDILLGAGAFIELSHYNSAISNKGCWAKIGLAL